MAYQTFREIFAKRRWYEALDVLELFAQQLRDDWGDRLTKECNRHLEGESSAYRFIDKRIVSITDDQEIEAIETALSKASSPIAAHLSRSLELLTDRENPDYRNAIKESISAIESWANQEIPQKKGRLAEQLREAGKALEQHPALTESMVKMYGWASDEDGVRHSINDNGRTVGFAEAKFCLVTCTAFLNYALAKSAD